MRIRVLVTTKTCDSRNIYLEIDGDYSDDKVNEALDAKIIEFEDSPDRLLDRDHLGRVTWMIELSDIESVRFFYENDGDDISDW